MASLQQQRQEQNYFVRLGSLSERLRNHAYEHSLGKLRKARQSAQEALQQLTNALSLVSVLGWPPSGRAAPPLTGLRSHPVVGGLGRLPPHQSVSVSSAV